MKETLILLTSNFPYGNGEAFLETELPYLAKSFTKVIIVPTKECTISNSRSIPKNCQVETSILLKKNNENRLQRFFSKIWASVFFSFFYKELVEISTKEISFSVLNELLTYSRDAILVKKVMAKIVPLHIIETESVLIYSYWCYGIAFGATLFNPNLHVISRAHRADLYEELYPNNYIPFRKLTYSNLDRIFTISENGFNYLVKKYPAFKNKFRLSRLGIPISKTTDIIQNAENKSFTIVSCSSVYNIKRVDKIAYALKNFASNNTNLELAWHHFGSGEMFNDLKKDVDQLPENMKAILHGHIENDALIEWYKNNTVDLFINLSKSEGIPVSIMEANSFGIPAIATNVGGTSELVSKSSGWLVDCNFTDEEISSVLQEALKNHPLRVNKGIEARNTCLTFFDSEKNYSGFVETISNY